MEKPKNFIESHPSFFMISAVVAGLAFPYGNLIPDAVIILALSLMMFLACFKINTPLHAVLSYRLAAFCVLRYLLIPVALWAALRPLAPELATAILLIALCPAGAASPAFTNFYNGNVALAFVITIVSSIASVFAIPAAFGLLGHQTIALPIGAMLQTLVLCILLPGVFYLPLRKRPRFKEFCENHGRSSTVLLVCLIYFTVFAKKQEYILAHPREILLLVLEVAAFFALATILGFAVKSPRADRIAYGACSAFNNIALGIGLALLYFDERTVLTTLAGEFVWAFLPLFFQPAIDRFSKKFPA
jgi:BASS family bile acid:Na+ symporter